MLNYKKQKKIVNVCEQEYENLKIENKRTREYGKYLMVNVGLGLCYIFTTGHFIWM